MKTADITPGLIYAAVSSVGNEHYNTEPRRYTRGGYARARPKPSDVHDGFDAAPVRVVAIGKFRWRQSGACTREIAEDYHTTNLHVQQVDVMATLGISGGRSYLPSGDARIGYPKGLKLTSSRVVWVDTIVTADKIIMPWTDFLKRREEYNLVKLEIAAYQQRLEAIKTKMRELINDVYAAARVHADNQLVQLARRRDDGKFLVYSWGDIEDADYVAISERRYYPIDSIPGMAELQAEYALVRDKLSCATS